MNLIQYDATRLICALGGRLRQETEANIQAVIRMLRAGKHAKEISFQLKMSWEAIRVMMHRHPEIRVAFIETYHLRYPHQQKPPAKIVQPLHNAEAC